MPAGPALLSLLWQHGFAVRCGRSIAPLASRIGIHMTALNVLGGPLLACSFDPLTGYLRDGCCQTDAEDHGTHVVCARMTEAFLAYSLSRGNDLMTPRPEFRFAGLKAGDRWCLCVLRWKEALRAGVAPPVHLAATHAKALELVTLEQLQLHAL
jgi:uncharacterized protein (DUF2237 family)